MTARTRRALAVTALVLLHTAPAANAVNPPAVDQRRLPTADSPRPPYPTAQFDECVGAAPAPTGPPGQLSGTYLPDIWALTRGAGQTVAVIDTGVTRHRRLPHLIPGGDYVSHHDGTADCDGHGTVVAGIIGASPESDDPRGFAGIAPDVTLLSIRQSSNKFHRIDDPGGRGMGDVSTLAAAVRTAADLGATVINISTVACVPAGTDLDDRALGAALAYAVDVKNVVVVTAAGNVGGPGHCQEANPREAVSAAQVRTVASPAWYDEYVLTVGSVNSDGAPSEFSLAGPWVDVAAPGEHIVSLASAGDGLTDLTSTGAAISGTSYAVPVVSAIAALVRARFPELTARQVMQRIEDTAHRPPADWDPAVGHGVIDAIAAISGRGPASRPSAAPVRAAMAQEVSGPPDPPGRAVRGAAICLCLTAGVAAVSAVTARRRHRG